MRHVSEAMGEFVATHCKVCGKALGSRNKSGLCLRHSAAALGRSGKGHPPTKPYITKTCPVCGGEFECPPSHAMRRKCCSVECLREETHQRAVRTYPPEDEVRRLYSEERLSDRELGKHYGHSYQWALKLRRHYGIKGRRKGEKTKPPTGDRSRWSIPLKREDGCRSCGAVGLLHLHHAVPRSIAPAGKYDLRNGVPLCARCHLGWHNGQVALYRDLFTVEEWRFIQTLIGPGWLDQRYPDRAKQFRKVVGLDAA